MSNLIVLISGHAGSGKTTAASLIKEYYKEKVTEFALADKLKLMVFNVLKLCNVDINSLQDLYTPGVKERYRHYLQQIGTEICQRTFNKTCWCEAIHSDINKFTQHIIVISDVRFLHEVAWFKNNYDNVISIRIESSNITQTALNHISEQELDNINVDYIVNNNDTKQHLQQELINIISKHIK